MPEFTFTVDAALLAELGERLVGKPYVALAELVKNAYDADATKVSIEFDIPNDCISVEDNGHGMTLDEFRDFWMRVGSTHKKTQRTSRDLKRPMTGSKGVGRLAVQLLADELRLVTIPKERGTKGLKAHANWEEAVTSGDLTQATVQYSRMHAPSPRCPRTRITLHGLKNKWTQNEIMGLAKEIWWLKPPFRAPTDKSQAFEIDFVSPNESDSELFNLQLNAILGIWDAAVVGKNVKGTVSLGLIFSGEDMLTHTFTIPDCELTKGNFEIRIYDLINRQPHGILVGEAREYFTEFGGVHVYDSGFHLPYYGTPKNDWLKIQWEHAQRISRSKLLPEALQTSGGLTHLPTLSRVFGVVNVDTSQESELEIMITRDRLAENKAFADLTYMVRYAFHFYAMHKARRVFESKASARDVVATTDRIANVDDVLEKYSQDVPETVYRDLKKGVQDAISTAESQAEARATQLGLLGSLATAGIMSLAYQHELRRQFTTVENIIDKLGSIKVHDVKVQQTLTEIRSDLSEWIQRAKATNALFEYLADNENIEVRRRFRAVKVIGDIWEQVTILNRDIKISTVGLDDDLELPKAGLVEWGAIFQNVFINAFNAMVDSERRLINVSSVSDGKDRYVYVQDTGCGIDLNGAEELFQPMVRKLEISPERHALGYGGMGLGLTIVKLVADNLNRKVEFVEPDSEFSTAFAISWREK